MNKLFCLLVIFLLIRFPGVTLPYHQDEWKNVAASVSVSEAGQFFAHPPLMQMIFVGTYKVFGEENFRFMPIIFGFASAALLYMVLRNRGKKKEALWALGIFSILFYNILGSLVPDVDGAILPFFFLLSVYFYDKWNSIHSTDDTKKWQKYKWFALLILTLLLGFLIKLNFILAIGAIALDYIFSNFSVWRKVSFKKVLINMLAIASALAGFVGIYIGLLYLIAFLYPAFDIHIMLGHANQFSEDVGRNWIQIAVQAVKSVFYISPLALSPLLFVSTDILKKTKLFSIYLFLGLIFYFVVFDFSRGALDKYLMFAIIPLSVIIGDIFAKIFAEIGEQKEKKEGGTQEGWWHVSLPIAFIACVFLAILNFLPHEVLPLYPKTLWFVRVIHAKWAILNPFNGGSGPLGFYVSFLFIAASFIISAVCVFAGLLKKSWRPGALLIVLFIGILYNGIFAEELFFGKINGSAPDVLAKSIEFISNRPDIKKVITYNDIGAGPLENIGKYAGRIYATPASEAGYKALFEKHVAAGGHFLVVGIPPLGPETFYGKFFSSCDSLFGTTSGRIRADVYTCKNELKK